MWHTVSDLCHVKHTPMYQQSLNLKKYFQSTALCLATITSLDEPMHHFSTLVFCPRKL